MVAPRAWAASPSSLPLACILRDSGFSISQTRKLPDFHPFDMVSNGLGFLGLRARRGLRLLLGQLARMHDHKAQGRVSDLSMAVLDLHRPDDALPVPTTARVGLGPPGFFR